MSVKDGFRFGIGLCLKGQRGEGKEYGVGFFS